MSAQFKWTAASVHVCSYHLNVFLNFIIIHCLLRYLDVLWIVCKITLLMQQVGAVYVADAGFPIGGNTGIHVLVVLVHYNASGRGLC